MEVAGPAGSEEFAFQFAVPAIYSFGPVMFSGGVYGGYVRGFNRCNYGCTLAQIVQIGKSTPLYLAPNFVLYTGPNTAYYCGSGGGSFNYSSGFSYAITYNVLTAQGNVTPRMQFTPNDFATCNPVGLPTYVISGPWKFSAEFVKENTLWFLVQSQFHPVP